MDFIKENFKTLIMCIILVAGAIIISFIVGNSKNNSGSGYRLGDTYLKDYKINEIIPIYVTDEEIAKKYLTDYVTLLIYDPEKAFSLLSDDTLIDKFESYKDFEKYRDSLITDAFVNATVIKYRYVVENNKNCLHVVDSVGNEFIFRENYIMDYTVSIV